MKKKKISVREKERRAMQSINADGGFGMDGEGGLTAFRRLSKKGFELVPQNK